MKTEDWRLVQTKCTIFVNYRGKVKRQLSSNMETFVNKYTLDILHLKKVITLDVSKLLQK